MTKRNRGMCGRRSGAVVQRLEGRLLLTAYHVTNTADAGAGSLRQAILNANANSGPDVIDFAIGQGPVTISPAQRYPDLTGPVTIDGTTQPGYSGQPIVEIEGSHAGTTLGGADGLKLLGGNSVVRGLVINSFSGTGLVVGDNGGNVFENNFVGTDLSGTQIRPNAIHGIALSSDGNRVGGPLPSQRNVISGNTGTNNANLGAGIFVFSSNNVIQGNYIGVDVTGGQYLGNRSGIVSFGDATHTPLNNRIGGSGPGEGNVISGNYSSAAVIGTDSWTIAGNLIGLDATGTRFVSNGDGLLLANSSFDTIGGATAAAGNRIEWNGKGIEISGGQGVVVRNNVIRSNSKTGVGILSGTGHRVTGNSIDGNGGLGIDLGADGITFNTPGGPHAGPNHLQNFPVLTSAQFDGFGVRITGTLNSTPLSTFTIDFYDAGSFPDFPGYGEGQTYLGSTTVTTDAGGNASFMAMVAAPGASFDDNISSTAAAADGSTSEFSLVQHVEAAPPPAVTAGGFNVLRYPHEVTFTFSQRVSDSIDAGDVVVRNLSTGAQFSPTGVRYDPSTETAAFALPTNLADGNYRATLKSAGVTNVAGAPLQEDAQVTFFELRGDANRDRKVDFNDLVLLAQSYNTSGGRTLANGDFDGNGNVDFNDLVLLAQRYNTTLALPTGAATAAMPATTGSVVKAEGGGVKPLFSRVRVVAVSPIRTKVTPSPRRR